MNFKPGNCSSHSNESAVYWFLFDDNQILIDISGSNDTCGVADTGSSDVDNTVVVVVGCH